MSRIAADTAIALVTARNARKWQSTDDKFLFVDGLIQDCEDCPWNLTDNPEQFTRLVDRIEGGFEILLS